MAHIGQEPGGGGDEYGRFLRRRPKQSRSRAMVRAVVQALDELLERGQELQDLTVEGLSRRAGIGSGSFYEYFRDKDSLLGVLIANVTERNFTRLADDLESALHSDLETTVRAFVRSATAVYLEHPERLRIIIRGIARLDLGKLVARERDRFAELLATRLSVYFPDAETDRFRLTMRLTADAGTGVILAAAERHQICNLDEVSELVADVALGIIRQRHASALAAPPGSRGS